MTATLIPLPPGPSASPGLQPTSGALGAAIRRVRQDGVVNVTPEIATEAAVRVMVLRDLLRGAKAKDALDWLYALSHAGLTHTPTDPAKIRTAGNAIWETCEALPASVWCNETRIASQRTQRFWPSPAEVFAHLAPYADVLRSELYACREIVRKAEAADLAARAIEAPAVSAEHRSAALEAVGALLRSMRVKTPGKTIGPAWHCLRPVRRPPTLKTRMRACYARSQSSGRRQRRVARHQRHACRGGAAIDRRVKGIAQ